MRKLVLAGLTCCLVSFVAAPSFAAGITADEAFDSLSSLVGTWKGTPEGEGDEAEASAEVAGEAQPAHDLAGRQGGARLLEPGDQQAPRGLADDGREVGPIGEEVALFDDHRGRAPGIGPAGEHQPVAVLSLAPLERLPPGRVRCA